MTYWSQVKKPEVEAQIKKAKITNKEVIRAILKFERRINTCWGMLEKGSSWETTITSQACTDAWNLIEDFNNGGYNCKEAKHWEDWKRYCEAGGICPDATTGDWLC